MDSSTRLMKERINHSRESDLAEFEVQSSSAKSRAGSTGHRTGGSYNIVGRSYSHRSSN